MVNGDESDPSLFILCLSVGYIAKEGDLLAWLMAMKLIQDCSFSVCRVYREERGSFSMVNGDESDPNLFILCLSVSVSLSISLSDWLVGWLAGCRKDNTNVLCCVLFKQSRKQIPVGLK